MRFAGLRIETGYQHIGPKLADYPNHVRQYFFPVPYLKGLVGVFRKAKVFGAAKELLAAVYTARLQQLLRAYNAQQLVQFGAYQVLAAIAAG